MQPCVLGGGEHASERVKRRRYERLPETTRFEVFTPGLAAREEERSGAAAGPHCSCRLFHCFCGNGCRRYICVFIGARFICDGLWKHTFSRTKRHSVGVAAVRSI